MSNGGVNQTEEAHVASLPRESLMTRAFRFIIKAEYHGSVNIAMLFLSLQEIKVDAVRLADTNKSVPCFREDDFTPP